jgi:DNA-directed RNA polymerase subunit M/transcription elongation factor TFIIS
MLDQLPDDIRLQVNEYASTQIIRQFCVNYALNPSATEHFSISELISDPQLWFIGTEEAKKRNDWLHEVYPKDIKCADDMEDSMLQCGKCKQHKVDYFQKQTRGADEPMTVFCHCLNCGARWRQ